MPRPGEALGTIRIASALDRRDRRHDRVPGVFADQQRHRAEARLEDA